MVTGVLVIALGMAALMWWVSGSDAPGSQAKPVKTLSATELVEATTHTSLRGAPADPDPQARTHGDIVRPKQVIAIHDRPAGSTIGKVGPDQIGETWLPVINQQQGWTQVLLPSKPNGSTGWLRDAHLDHKRTPYLISVHLKSMKLKLFHEGRKTGEWTIGIGKPDTPTPTGRTFLLGSIVDPNQQYSPIIL
ncbi:MAG: murein L,D-transpeptidase, partial [Actinophytocola sp.]|nr:murein L,D-transpeptidase [Actinophytocola sp.]